MVLHARMCWSNPIGIVRVLAAMKDQRVKYVIFKISINLKINLISYKIKFLKAICSSNPCQNGGSCSNFNNATSPFYGCACANGYTGYNCEIRKIQN
jgi:hypothetical protein